MSGTHFLYDDQVALVPLEERHVPAMTRWVNDQSVLQYLALMGMLSEEEELGWLKRLRDSSTDRVLGIVRRGDDRHVGNVGLHGISPVHQVAEYGIMIGETDCWGQGLGTAAGRLMCNFGFNTLNLHRIFLRVLGHNERGIRSYEKLGFELEGCLREHDFINGAYHDMVFMGVLRDEFNERWTDWREDQQRRYGIAQ